MLGVRCPKCNQASAMDRVKRTNGLCPGCASRIPKSVLSAPEELDAEELKTKLTATRVGFILLMALAAIAGLGILARNL